MPRVDSDDLLDCLEPVLSDGGGIKNRDEVTILSSLSEKYANKLVSKCVYLNVLKSSSAQLLSLFMSYGGWNLINSWVGLAVEKENWDLVRLLLEVIKVCPVDVERLKSNSLPRHVKYLSKATFPEPEIKDLASEIVRNWLIIVKAPAGEQVSKIKVSEEPSVVSSTVQPSIEHTEIQTPTTKEAVSVEIKNDNELIKNPPQPVSIKNEIKNPPQPVSVKNEIREEKIRPKKITSKIDEESVVALKLDRKKMESMRKLLKKRQMMKEAAKDEKRQRRSSPSEDHSISKKHLSPKEIDKCLSKSPIKTIDSPKPSSSKGIIQRSILMKKAALEKTHADLAKLIPRSIPKLGKIPKLSRSLSKDDTKDPGEDKVLQNQTLVEGPRKPTLGYNDRRTATPKISEAIAKEILESKPKTVKSFNSKFRLTGLEENSNVPPKQISRKAVLDKPIKRLSPTKELFFELPEKKLKSPEVSEEKLYKKPKPAFLQESVGFIDAMMTAVNVKKDLRKKKKIKPEDTHGYASSSILGTKLITDIKDQKPKLTPPIEIEEEKMDTEIPPPELKPPVFKFYKDTLESPVDEKEVISENNSKSDVSTDSIEKEEIKVDKEIVHEKWVKDVIKDSESYNDEDVGDEEDEKENKEIKVITDMKEKELKSILALGKSQVSSKKSVKWATEEQLELVNYFEVDETERVNVTRTFLDMQLMEKYNERNIFSKGRHNLEDDKMEEMIEWQPLQLVEARPRKTPHGALSTEIQTQYLREQSTPPAIYYSTFTIPDSPEEPAPEIVAPHVPVVIPTSDLSGEPDVVADFSMYGGWPEPKPAIEIESPPGVDKATCPCISFVQPNVPPSTVFPPDPNFMRTVPPFGQGVFNPVPGPSPVPPPTYQLPQQVLDGNNQGMPNGLSSMNMPYAMMPPPQFSVPPPTLFPPNNNVAPSSMTSQPGTVTNSRRGRWGGPNDNTNTMDGEQSAFPDPYRRPNRGGGIRGRPDRDYERNRDRGQKFPRIDSFRGHPNSQRGERGRGRLSRGRGGFWRGGGGGGGIKNGPPPANSGFNKICGQYQKFGYCNINNCRFFHPK